MCLGPDKVSVEIPVTQAEKSDSFIGHLEVYWG